MCRAKCCVHNASTVPWTSAGQFGRPGPSEDVPGMTYDVPGVSYPIPWTSGDCPQGVRPADGPGTHSLASTGPFSQAAVHGASGLLRFSQSQRGPIVDRKLGCPRGVRPPVPNVRTRCDWLNSSRTDAPWATQLPVHNAAETKPEIDVPEVAFGNMATLLGLLTFSWIIN